MEGPLVGYRGNMLDLGTEWDGTGPRLVSTRFGVGHCVIFSTPDGRVLPISQAVMAGRHKL